MNQKKIMNKKGIEINSFYNQQVMGMVIERQQTVALLWHVLIY